MRNLLLTPAQRATLRTYPATLPGVAAEPSADVRAELDNLRYYWRLSAREAASVRALALALGLRVADLTATLPGVAAAPSADVRAELDNVRYYWRLSALECEIQSAYSIATGGR